MASTDKPAAVTASATMPADALPRTIDAAQPGNASASAQRAVAGSGQVALDDGRLPIVLGITGHRRLGCEESWLRSVLQARIRALQERCPHSPFVVLSPLAEGADRAFARAALDLHIPLYVALPMPAVRYEATFPDSVEAFRELCAKAVCVFVAEVGVDLDLDPSLVDERGADSNDPERWQRRLAYVRAGLYVAQHSHVLFALWDRDGTHGLGGTAQIRQYKLTGHLGSFRVTADGAALKPDGLTFQLLDKPEPGLIVDITVPRAPATGVTAAVSEPVDVEIDGWAVAPLFQRLDCYNRDVLHGRKAADEAMPVATPMDEDAPVQTEYQRLLQRGRSASRLARGHMSRLRLGFALLFAATWVAIIAEEIFGNLWPSQPGTLTALLVFLATLSVILLMVSWVRKERHNARVNEYRALAEGLRVQRAWFMAGVQDLVSRHYLRRHSRALGWLNFALRGVALSQRTRVAPADIARVKRDWIDGQRAYLASGRDKRERVARGLGRTAHALFAIGLLLAVALLVLVLVFHRDGLETLMGPAPGPLAPLNLMVYVQAILLATSGLLSGYIEFAGYEDDVREYTRNLANFDLCATRLDGLTLAQQQTLLHETGIEAIRENAEWTILHESHDAKVPF